ncbi:unnamed protein product [Dibothriocephalus latus]|uniref:Uncharacterized protein n=1 Tax=Dibothriocephalus latus TaxID=60516 RepID=A0A3P7LTI8_DIBLA|nr:unnamed protein product [Dibothriocephalus latus]
MAQHFRMRDQNFRSVLNRSSTISDAALAWLVQLDANYDPDLPPFLPESIHDLRKLSSGTTSGSDSIPTEVYEHSVRRLMAEITANFQEMCRNGLPLHVEKEPATLC